MSHEVHTVFEKGWSQLKNGDLLATAILHGYEVLVSTDQNLRHQHWPCPRWWCRIGSHDGANYLMGRLSLKVVPGSSRDEIVGWLGDSLKVKVKAPPDKGRANEAVVALLAERLGIDTSSITVASGHTSPAKVVAIDGMDDEAIRAAFPREKPG